MTKIILVFVLYLFTIIAFSQSATSLEIVEKETNITIRVTIKNIASNKGKVMYSLYNKKGFLVKPLMSQHSLIVDKKTSVAFANVPAGTYSIVCFHDKNDNNRIDFSESGMPLENYGASKNAMSMGPPQFQPSKFEVTNKDLTFEIKF